MQRGTSVVKNDLTEGIIPVISGGLLPSFYCDTYNRNGETITVAGSGVNAGYVQYWNTPVFVNDAFSIKGIDGISTKYLYYYLSSLQKRIYETKKGAGIQHVHISSIENIKIPVPPMEVQEKIVNVLDNFDKICSDLQIGLPAEIDERKKQYSHYRDLLLTYAATGKIVHGTNTNTPPSKTLS